MIRIERDERLVTEIERAAAEGGRAAVRQRAVPAATHAVWSGHLAGTDGSDGRIAGSPALRGQLARAARQISTEALGADLAAERGDWQTVRATYQRLALLFAEYRLLYVQCLPLVK